MDYKTELEVINNPQQKIIIKTSMDITDGQLFQLEPDSLMALQEVTQQFQPGCLYSEKEINAILENFYDDFIALRRYLIEYGFLDRKPDGSQYWRKK